MGRSFETLEEPWDAVSGILKEFNLGILKSGFEDRMTTIQRYIEVKEEHIK
jgi:hypothetical protein